MTRDRIKIISSIMTVFAVIFGIALSSSALSGTTEGIQQNGDQKLYHATGLKEPTKEDLDWMKKNMIQAEKILPNDIGLKRANEFRAKKGLKALGKNKAVPKGQEVVPTDSNLSNAALNFDASAEGIEALGSASLPKYVDNSELPYFPPIKDQGSIGSCAAFASTYYQATYMTAMARGWDVRDDNDNSNKFSPKWTYNLLNGGTDEGSTALSAYRLFLENGIATWADLPYNGDGSVPENYLEWSTEESVWRNAINYKIDKVGYVKIADGTDTPVTSPHSPALNDIKQLLNNGYVLLYSTSIYSWRYKTINDDPVTVADNEFAGKSAAFMQDGYAGSHMMTVVGYNDDIWVDINEDNIAEPAEKGAFRIANSWGDGWEDNGFSWIAYDALNKVSAVSGAPEAIYQRDSIWDAENIACWLTAKASYTPDVIGEITLNHAKRNQVTLELGMQNADGTDSVTYKPIAVNIGNTEYAFDGTNIPCDATFVFDYSDMFKGENIAGVTKNWSIKVGDTNPDGSGALVESFSVINPLSGNTATCSQSNQNADGGAVTFSAALTLPYQDTDESEWLFKEPMPFGMGVYKSYQFDNKIYAVGYIPGTGAELICYDPLLEQTSWIRSVDYYDWSLSAGYDNKIYLFNENNVKVYDINTGLMSSKSAIPCKKVNASVVELDGKIYIIDGYLIDENENWTLDNGVMVYDPVADTWSTAADTNIARNAPGAAVLNDRIYIFGGYDSQYNIYESIEEYDPDTNQWTLTGGYLPCPVQSKFVSAGNKIYTLGADNLNLVFEYDPASNQWNEHDSIPEKYYEFAAESLNGKIYVLGGKCLFFTGDEYLSKNILEFSPSLPEAASAPVFSPDGGTYTSIQSVTLSSATEGATIRYTTDGTPPTSASAVYTGSITVSGSKVIRAYAQKDGLRDSNVSGATYTLSIRVGDVNGDGDVDSIDYGFLTQYTRGQISDFPVEDDLWAGDLDGDGLINDTDASLMRQYIFEEISFFPKEQVMEPTFNPEEGTYTSIQVIALSSATEGAIIRYTTDGTNPTSASAIYTAPITVAGSKTIKAYAQKDGLPDSGVSSATYTLLIKVGDVNGDGDVDSTDYGMLMQYIRGQINNFPVEDDLWAGDLDGDGSINNTDGSLMWQYLSGEISLFPKEQS